MTVKRPQPDRGPVWGPERLKDERERRKASRRLRKTRRTKRHVPPTAFALAGNEAAEADLLADELGLLAVPCPGGGAE